MAHIYEAAIIAGSGKTVRAGSHSKDKLIEWVKEKAKLDNMTYMEGWIWHGKEKKFRVMFSEFQLID